MKHLRLTGLCLLLLLLLTACGRANPRTVTVNSRDYSVDVEAHTITDASTGKVYTYSLSADSLSISYPDGKYWSVHYSDNGFGSGSGNVDFTTSPSPDTLEKVLEEADVRRHSSGGKVLGFILLLLLGIISLTAPEAMWQLEWGWRFKDSEPSTLALVFERIVGGIAVLAAVFLILS